MQLSQLAAKYLNREDRILLRIGSDEGEATVWLTRRLLKRMWPLMGKIADTLAARQAPAQPARREIGEFQRQAALEQADFASPYRAAATKIWPQPLLVTKLVLKSAPSGLPILWLRDEAGVGIELPMDVTIHAGFCELLRQCARESDWDLGLEYGQAGQPPTAAPVH